MDPLVDTEYTEVDMELDTEQHTEERTEVELVRNIFTCLNSCPLGYGGYGGYGGKQKFDLCCV